MFDLTIPEQLTEQFNVELPALAEPWQIGLIVGPSGSGKSTVAAHAYGTQLFRGHDWPRERAVIDAFPSPLGIKEITGMLTAVGFSSPPSWVKPYHVLSNGERFRCDLALALLGAGDSGLGTGGIREGEAPAEPRLVVFDEFTSVVDRTVAKIGSAAVAKAIRRINTPPASSSLPPLNPSTLPSLRFIAVACHYDIAEWLQPDWVLDMQTQFLERRLLRRPGIDVEIRQGDRSLWENFKKHHYLSHSLPSACSFYVALVDGQPASLVVTATHFGKCHLDHGMRGVRRIARIVTLPDFQGVGIGGVLLDTVGELLAADGLQSRITTSHPGMIARLRKSPRWRVSAFQFGTAKRVNSTAKKRGLSQTLQNFKNAGARYILSAKYRPAAVE